MNELRQYLPLYLGCNIQYPDIEGKLIVAKLTGITNGDGVETTYIETQIGEDCVGDYLAFKNNGNHTSDALHLKLILSPLSSMTEEEMNKIDLTDKEFLIVNIENGNEPTLTAEHLIYLISRGFDLFQLKEKGLAIYQEP